MQWIRNESHLVLRRMAKDERTGFFAFNVFLMSCDCWCFVSLSHIAVGWIVIVLFPGQIHLLFEHVMSFEKVGFTWSKLMGLFELPYLEVPCMQRINRICEYKAK